MRSVAVLVLTLAVGLGSAFADTKVHQQKPSKLEKEMAEAAEKRKSITLSGSVKTEDNKTLFTPDKEKQAWRIANPDMLLGHESTRIKVEAVPNAGDRSIIVDEVEDLKPLKPEKKKSESKKEESKKKKKHLIFF